MTHPMMSFRFTVSFLLLLGLLMSLSLNADAKWFGKDKKAEEAVKQVQTYQPPPEDGLNTHCEPIRMAAARLNQKPKVIRFFNRPHRALLIRRHQECKKDYMTQEYDYLKHVDTQRAPSLPKMKPVPTESEKETGKRDGDATQ